MSSSASASARPRAAHRRRPPASSGRRSGAAGAAGRVRWDRLARVAMLFVLAALVYLYVSAGVHMFSTWRQSSRDHATVAGLEAEHRALLRQHNLLSTQSALEAEARRLGMVKPGEQPYLVGGLPRN